MRYRSVFVAAFIVIAGLGGCSSEDGPDSAYCKDLEQSREVLDSLSANDLGKLDNAFETIHRLADKAPGDVTGDWNRLDRAVGTVEDAMDDARLTASDFRKIQQGDLPAGATQSDLQAVAISLQSMTSEDLADSSAAIEAHANSVCEVPLDGF